MKTKHISRIIHLEIVDSTNEFLKRCNLEHGLCVVARHQTKGKGRRGRNWISAKNKGIYTSFMLHRKKVKSPAMLSLATGIAVAKTLLSFKKGFYVKWPNDIYINGRKISGILTEILRDRIIIGIGINTYHSVSDLKQADKPATSLKEEGINIKSDIVFKKLIENINKYITKIQKNAFSIEEYEELCPMIGKEVTIITNKIELIGKCLGVDKEGFLVIQLKDGIKRLSDADVSIRCPECGHQT